MSVFAKSSASIWSLLSCNWCFRQSIDLYGSVPSPNTGFLGTTSLSRLGSSFISSSLIRRHTPVPETIPSAKKPLLLPTEDEQQRHSSHILPSPHPFRRSSIRKEVSKVSHEVHIPGHCTFGQAVLNGKQLNLFGTL